MSKMKCQMPFKSVHLKEYCLVIVEHAPQSAEVVSVSCSFCVNFGREEKPGAKCKAAANMMYFKKALEQIHINDIWKTSILSIGSNINPLVMH